MKKLALDLESLSVQSFATTAARQGLRGTVNGHLANTDNCRVTHDAACGPWTTGPGPEPSAGGTCVLGACVPLTAPHDD